MEELNITFDNININPIETEIDTPMIVQTDGLSIDDALAFVKDCAEGKRKIAKAVRNKYETITEEESDITEYSTFDELSNKISQIPVEVPLGNAMEQNGGVLPFYDVYNEALKAMKEFAGYGFNGVCAFELYKWDYNNDHKITLSGADAYYVNDNNELLGSMSEYQFNDLNNGKTNRFVIFFFKNKQYSMPPYLPSHGVKGVISIKGNPLIIINETVPYLFYIRTYEGDLEVKSQNDFYIANTSNLREIDINHIKKLTSSCIRNNTNLFNISIGVKEVNGGANNFNLNSANKCVFFPNLELITNINQVLGSNNGGYYYMFAFPKLKKIEGAYIALTNGSRVTVNEIKLDSLEIIELSTTYPLFGWIELKSTLKLPKLHKCTALIVSGYNNIYDSIIPSIQLGDGQKDGVAGDIVLIANGRANTNLTSLTVAKGFKAKLDLTGCNGLSKQCVLDIFENLADLTEEGITLNIIFGSATANAIGLTEDDYTEARAKGWSIS